MQSQMNINSALGVLALVIISLIGGVAAVGYVSVVEGNLLLISALPFILAMLMFLIIDKRKLFLLILLLRATGDIVFETSKFGGGFGVGGLINALVIFIALLFIIERPSLLNRRIISIWGAVLLVALAAIGYAPDFKDAVRLFLALSSYCAVFTIAFYVVRTKADFELCVSTILLSSLLPVLYSFVDIALHGNTVNSEEGFRLQSTFSHPNIFAFYLVLNISLLFYKLKTTWSKISKPMQLAGYLYLFLLLALLMLTKTRSAWAACGFIFTAYGLLFERKYLLYLLFAPLLALLVPSIRDRLLDLGSGNEYVQYAKLNSFAWRLLLWKSAFEWITPQNAVFGYGLNAFKYYSPDFFPLAGKTNFGAHSTYVQWFFETGVVGVLSSAWMHMRLLFTLKLGLRQHKLRTAIAIMLVFAYLFFAFSDNLLDYLAFNWYFWFFIGSACALSMSVGPDPESGQLAAKGVRYAT
ncbi:MAG TPA: O-antigen ligase family protein [Methylophilaceae bacterium]